MAGVTDEPNHTANPTTNVAATPAQTRWEWTIVRRPAGWRVALCFNRGDVKSQRLMDEPLRIAHALGISGARHTVLYVQRAFLIQACRISPQFFL